jgi:uroporphyrinogen III methyltransferase / synthase
MHIRPVVYIIGAGPGDPGLITARGLQCLGMADVVLYDHLVSPRLLRYAPIHAERIDLGEAAPRALDQEAICYLLAEKARDGHVVARLKWGDPYVFDQGGQEALFLHEQGIPFEVVPGVPAAVGVPGYAGVPVTYPGGGNTLTIVRGHEDESQGVPRVDWAALARLNGTLVCYAGSRQLPTILEALSTQGEAGSQSAAAIFNGTLPAQRTWQGTVDELAAQAKASPPREPSILVVGRVTALRQHLRWFDERPLFGRRIMVTRPREDAAELVDLLTVLGAAAIEAPMTRIVPPDDYGPLDETLGALDSFEWVLFTSANAVDQFMQRLMQGTGDVRRLAHTQICTIGPVTRDRLRRYHLKVDLMPDDGHPEAVVQALAARGSLEGVRVLLPRPDVGRELLAAELRKAGAVVTDVTAYKLVVSEPERVGEPDIYRMLLDGEIDVVTFTSASTVRNFVTTIGHDQAQDLLRQTTVACIGPVTAEAAAQLGIGTQIMPSEYTVPALAEAIVNHYAGTAASNAEGGMRSAEPGANSEFGTRK